MRFKLVSHSTSGSHSGVGGVFFLFILLTQSPLHNLYFFLTFTFSCLLPLPSAILHLSLFSPHFHPPYWLSFLHPHSSLPHSLSNISIFLSPSSFLFSFTPCLISFILSILSFALFILFFFNHLRHAFVRIGYSCLLSLLFFFFLKFCFALLPRGLSNRLPVILKRREFQYNLSVSQGG